MPRLTVDVNDSTYQVEYTRGSSMREILDAARIPIRTGCRGNGACGLCLVEITAGEVNDLTRNERSILSPEHIARNTRLACQVVPEHDLHIRILNTTAASRWRDQDTSHLPGAPSPLHRANDTRSANTSYGVAIDIGTTHISLSLWDLGNGRRLFSRAGANPQSTYGTDVMTRLMAACESPANARSLADLPIEAIRDALADVCADGGLKADQINCVAIVGNTPMLVMLTRTDPQTLLQPNNWTQTIDCQLDDPAAWARILGVNAAATVELFPPLVGFIGSDLLAGVLATRLTEQPGSLLIDFGTNSEAALWDGATLWVVSAAGGPAFESCDTTCGMPAEPGAIYRVDRQSDSSQLRYHVIGGGEAQGLCGSGLVDLIAALVRTGDVNRIGKLSNPDHGDGFVVQAANPTIRLTNRDIDAFQRAKAAIGTAVKALLSAAHLGAEDLQRICVCGVFGQHLDIPNAQMIGLVPSAPVKRFELCGNTALAGCEWLLLSPDGTEDLASLRRRAVLVSLHQRSDFEAMFLENLFLQPLSAGEQ